VTRTIRQPPSFVFTYLVIFFEYMRPQGTYPALNVLPWARIALVLAVIACVIEKKNAFRRKEGWVLLAAFTAVILLSIVQAVYPSVGWSTVDLWFSWIVLIYVVSASADNEERLILLLAAFILWNFRMSFGGVRRWASIGFAFRDWGLSGPSGWFQNSGEFGIEMCVFLPICIYFLIGLKPNISRWKQLALVFAAVTSVASMAGSASRGALLGGAAVGLWVLWRSPNRMKGMIAITTLAAVTWITLPDEQKARFQSAGADRTSVKRLTYWADGIEITNQHPLLGIGYDNWMPYYATYYNPKGQLPHNIFIEAASELGYVGLLVFLALIGYVFWENARTRKITARTGRNPSQFLYYTAYGLDGALIGYLVSGFFVTVLYYPYFWVNLAFTIALANVARAGSVIQGKALAPVGSRRVSISRSLRTYQRTSLRHRPR
jgi:O-antigen ligase